MTRLVERGCCILRFVVATTTTLRSFPYAAELRRELSLRNREFAAKHGLLNRESYGEQPVVCYLPAEDGSGHGNFLAETYKAILQNENWRKRLEKVHAQARGSLPHEDRRWRELDSSNSSDALLMNIFCFPGTLKNTRVFDMLAIERGQMPWFGVKARVPLANGRADRTEIDMRLGGLLVEAKLTEADFQSAECEVVAAYRDFHEVFDEPALPREGNRYKSYQLIRNVLAAQANDCSFCVIADARRPDLMEAWFAVMRCVRVTGLRLRCKMITWQELSEILPRKLRVFLGEKYGIGAAGLPSAESLCS
jgi:Restriction Endonuclease associating with ARP